MDISNLIEQARLALRLIRERPLELRLYGGKEAQSAFRSFTGPHRRVPFLRNKTFGIALLPIPTEAGDPFNGQRFRAIRSRRKRALARGYKVALFDAKQSVDGILHVNRSSVYRQGKPLSASYTDPAAVARYCERPGPFFGVFDSSGALRAYCHAPTIGDVALLARFLGEYDRLQDGIMYLLLSEIVSTLASERLRDGHPGWIMYDTLVGAGSGMRIFKQNCGFEPYRVTWVWADGPGA